MNAVGRKKVIAKYIMNQFEGDYASAQISIREYMNPFTGYENKKTKVLSLRDSREKKFDWNSFSSLLVASPVLFIISF